MPASPVRTGPSPTATARWKIGVLHEMPTRAPGVDGDQPDVALHDRAGVLHRALDRRPARRIPAATSCAATASMIRSPVPVAETAQTRSFA